MKFDLSESAREHRLIVAHRGVAGGNIPCNTYASYEIALMQGADMIETDIDCTRDGELVIFHPGMERNHLYRNDIRIPELTYEKVKELRFVNGDNTVTQFGILRFDDLLEQLKGRCYINVDKFWGNPEAIYRAIKRHGMEDQVLVKSAISEKVISVLEDLAPELPFMPIVSEAHPLHKELMKRRINYVGAEVLFKKDDSHLASEEFIDMMHRDGKLVWVNSIIYSYKEQLSGGHSDDSALCESMEYGWGWLADRGFDLIQTDWCGMLVNFLKETGRYYK